ncbi:hypothetical protein L2E82_22485 [Cichorium intybus]|uniref:Uncharacterized protein n=1 Tax=Cichorium intybus TaxID=13427 RepID=A0ACB9DXP5_CICIN|nr:hypothetical protein L2E82_22485 [Cichorium intybus]
MRFSVNIKVKLGDFDQLWSNLKYFGHYQSTKNCLLKIANEDIIILTAAHDSLKAQVQDKEFVFKKFEGVQMKLRKMIEKDDDKSSPEKNSSNTSSTVTSDDHVDQGTEADGCSKKSDEQPSTTEERSFPDVPTLSVGDLQPKISQLQRTANKLDLKLLGPNTFILMKQVRKNSDGYKGLRKLVKFGRFTDVKEGPEVPVAPAVDVEETPEDVEETPEVPVVPSADAEKEKEEESQDEEHNELTAKELDDLTESVFGPLGNENETETEVPQPSVLIPPQQDAAANAEPKEDFQRYSCCNYHAH